MKKDNNNYSWDYYNFVDAVEVPVPQARAVQAASAGLQAVPQVNYFLLKYQFFKQGIRKLLLMLQMVFKLINT